MSDSPKLEESAHKSLTPNPWNCPETDTTDGRSDPWIHLTERKQFSRLLYANPVCFLCTNGPTHEVEAAADGGSVIRPLQPNVMVVTWLTATNNHGQFLMSINRHRHTATFFESAATTSHDEHFTLCVPVKGMEELVKNVGGTSGRFGNKFALLDRYGTNYHEAS